MSLLNIPHAQSGWVVVVVFLHFKMYLLFENHHFGVFDQDGCNADEI